MPPSADVDLHSSSDALLSDFLRAGDNTARDEALRVLLEREAAPVISGVLQRKQSNGSDAEDVTSAAREQVIRQLRALRRGERETPIRDFRSYVAGIAYSAWADHLRNEHPERSMLLNRIRYLLENRTARGGFALWETPGGRKWCGFSEWVTSTPRTPTPKLQRLIADPVGTAREAFGDRYWQRNELATLVADLFRWLESPIEMRDLVFVVSEILEIAGRADDLQSRPEDEANETPTYRSASEEVIWKEYLGWLWRQIGELSARQCAAFLLNSSVLRDFELHGVASIRSLAPRLQMKPDQLALVWQRLPLDDNDIAEELRCDRQQVINLRRVARDSLSRAWFDFLRQSDSGGNKLSRPASSFA